MDTANLEERELKKMVKKIVRDVVGESEQLTIPVEMSARHVHLSQEDVEALFGHDAELTFKRALSLPGFLAEERVTVVTAVSYTHLDVYKRQPMGLENTSTRSL